MSSYKGLSGAHNFALRIGFAFALIAGIAGCAVGPKYDRPTVKLQPFHNAPSVETRATSLPAPPLDQWWTGFRDPELTRIVKRALDQNLDLAAAMTRVQQARAAARGAGAQRMPSGNLNASTTTIHQSTESMTGRLASHLPGYDRNQNYYDLGFAASWEADLFGGLKRGAEAATAEAQAAEASQTGTRITVAAEAADAYLQIRGAQARLNFTKEQIATDDHLVELVQQRRDAGIASDRELAQAQAVLSQARATIPLITVSLEAQLNRLDVLMGAQPGTYAAELTPVAEIPDVPEISGFGSPTDLLRRRPDIIAAERMVAASNARIGQALAEYYPKLSLSGIVGSQAVAPAHLFEQQGFQPASVVGLRWRLFDFGRVASEVQSARGANAEALLRYRSSVLHAAEDVEDSFSLLVQSENRRNEIVREIAELQRVRDRSEESYAAGVIGLTDVLDADRQLLVAKDDLAVARENAARAAVGSYRALGGGWIQ
ncbi:efflux transporter outer membrane subunit [Terriglobus albidus]|uniref:Efflux transporter outer membrane subunit n=1 Tax=Terriglobus albidus TaxID=1592106 RepID=A0A5B9E660_9BACT|nr:efflux transporter outer membrane subunit [Terriglobus albidus]QEE26565.1 efflux transporter outer membrane subunit [Terriglobus albidus]